MPEGGPWGRHLSGSEELLVEHADVAQRLGGGGEQRYIDASGAGRHEARSNLRMLAGQRGRALGGSGRCGPGLRFGLPFSACMESLEIYAADSCKDLLISFQLVSATCRASQSVPMG